MYITLWISKKIANKIKTFVSCIFETLKLKTISDFSIDVSKVSQILYYIAILFEHLMLWEINRYLYRNEYINPECPVLLPKFSNGEYHNQAIVYML